MATKKSVTLDLPGGPEAVPAIATSKDGRLIVHRELQDPRGAYRPGYAVTHVPTACKVHHTRTVAEACKVLRAIGGFDWKFTSRGSRKVQGRKGREIQAAIRDALAPETKLAGGQTPLELQVNLGVLTAAVSRRMLCGCGVILDVRRAVYVDSPRGAAVSCAACYEQVPAQRRSTFAADPETTVIDGRRVAS